MVDIRARLVRDESGATSIEYCLIAAEIGLGRELINEHR